MKSFSSDLLALLQRNSAVWPNTDFSSLLRVNLFMIGPAANGQTLYACDGQLPITYPASGTLAKTYQPLSYGNWSRGAISAKLGLSAGTMKLSVSSSQQNPVYFPGTSNGLLLLDGIKAGMLDAASVTVYTVYSPRGSYGQVTGPTGGSLVETKFAGQITNITKLGETLCEMEVSDLRYLLNLDAPQRLVSPNCWWELYSTGCTLSSGSFSRTGAVASSSASTIFATTAHLAPISAAGTFTQGYLVWTSGKNAGLANYVRLWTPGGSSDTIQLDVPPILGFNAGDTFTIYQGCNHTFTSCLDLQGNTNAYKNFGGFPTVPVPETAI